ncbi:hypothetical protein ACEZDB_35715 [Streptacidiphilus sp. N1-3]|uniref:Uncharacterized protein n=1 Tax=Streptacidiphilus alkalitolerans TaxID=3342712 RepID=A0ABV6XCI4_9ACTN
MTGDGPDYWWTSTPPSGPSGQQPDPPDDGTWGTPEPPVYGDPDPVREDLRDAADAMRSAAEAIRDAATPSAPGPERNWDFSWITGWLRTSVHGIACKRALYSSGPGAALMLFYYEVSSGHDPGGMAVMLILLAALVNAVIRSSFSRWLMWGTILGPLMYPPALVAIAFDLAQVLF